MHVVETGKFYEELNVVTGLDHLEGETVKILANGQVHPDKVVGGGQVSLDYKASIVNVGFGYESILKPMALELGLEDGTSQSREKRIHRLAINVLDSLGMQVSRSTTNYDSISFRDADDSMDDSPPLFSGWHLIGFEGDHGLEGDIVIKQDEPLPLTILSIVPKLYVTGDEGR